MILRKWNLEGKFVYYKQLVIPLPNVAVMVDMLKLGELPWR